MIWFKQGPRGPLDAEAVTVDARPVQLAATVTVEYADACRLRVALAAACELALGAGRVDDALEAHVRTVASARALSVARLVVGGIASFKARCGETVQYSAGRAPRRGETVRLTVRYVGPALERARGVFRNEWAVIAVENGADQNGARIGDE